MLVAFEDFGFGAEVDADAVAEDGFAVEELADFDGGGGGGEGADDAAHGFERGEGVDRGVGGEGGVDGFEVGGGEDFGGLEVGD